MTDDTLETEPLLTTKEKKEIRVILKGIRTTEWNPDNDLSLSPLSPVELQQTRRLLGWYERRVRANAFARAWGTWLLGLPTFILAVWTIFHMFSTGGK